MCWRQNEVQKIVSSAAGKFISNAHFTSANYWARHQTIDLLWPLIISTFQIKEITVISNVFLHVHSAHWYCKHEESTLLALFYSHAIHHWVHSLDPKFSMPIFLLCIFVHLFACENLIDIMEIDPLNLKDLGAEVKLYFFRQTVPLFTMIIYCASSDSTMIWQYLVFSFEDRV